MTGHFLSDWLQLALSLFCCILLLWLGLTLLLNSERRTGSVLLATGMALFGSAFFAAHTALLQVAGHAPASSLDFWWQMGWFVLIALPYGWCVIVFWFGGYGSEQAPLQRTQRALLGALGALAVGLTGALALGLALPTFVQMLQLQLGGIAGVLGLPWFLVVYPLYMLACMALAFVSLRGIAPDQAAGFPGNEGVTLPPFRPKQGLSRRNRQRDGPAAPIPNGRHDGLIEDQSARALVLRSERHHRAFAHQIRHPAGVARRKAVVPAAHDMVEFIQRIAVGHPRFTLLIGVEQFAIAIEGQGHGNAKAGGPGVQRPRPRVPSLDRAPR